MKNQTKGADSVLAFFLLLKLYMTMTFEQDEINSSVLTWPSVASPID